MSTLGNYRVATQSSTPPFSTVLYNICIRATATEIACVSGSPQGVTSRIDQCVLLPYGEIPLIPPLPVGVRSIRALTARSDRVSVFTQALALNLTLSGIEAGKWVCLLHILHMSVSKSSSTSPCEKELQITITTVSWDEPSSYRTRSVCRSCLCDSDGV